MKKSLSVYILCLREIRVILIPNIAGIERPIPPCTFPGRQQCTLTLLALSLRILSLSYPSLSVSPISRPSECRSDLGVDSEESLTFQMKAKRSHHSQHHFGDECDQIGEGKKLLDRESKGI